MGSGFAAAAFAAGAHWRQRKFGCVPPAQAPMLLLLLLLLLLLPFSPSCCLCCGCRCCVAALPSWWSCCSSCCPSCAHHPYVSFRKEYCVEKHKQLFHLLSFQAKGIALKTHKVLLPCSACLVHKEPTKERGEDERSAACRPVHSLARQRDRRRAAARPLCGVRAVTRVLAAGRTTKRKRPFI